MLELLIANWRLVLMAGLVAANGMLYHLWQSKDHELFEFKLELEVKMKQAMAEKAAVEQRQQLAFVEIKNDYEKKLRGVRSDAVRAYGLRWPEPSPSYLSGITGGAKVPNGAGKECVANSAFIGDAGEDALKLEQFQSFVRKNKLPVEGE